MHVAQVRASWRALFYEILGGLDGSRVRGG